MDPKEISIIHVPLEELPALLAKLAQWLKPGGYLLISVGYDAWTGTEADWQDVEGASMYWSHAGAGTYRQWLDELGLAGVEEGFLPEGDGSHTILLRHKQAGSPGPEVVRSPAPDG